jgi:hypothetical protein
MADRPHDVMSPVARRFALWSALMLAAYVVAVPVLTELQVLDRASRAAAHAAAWVLNSIGVEASVNERVLVARGMHYLVTPDCITTPLIAFYLAAFFASSLSWRARLLGVAAGVPVFAALAVLRLLTVAFPAVVLGTNLILTHGFNQLLAGVVVLLAVALWARGERPPSHAVAMGLFVAVAVAVAGATLGLGYAQGWSNLLHALRLPAPPGLTPVAGDGDVQGAMVALPIYQVAIFAASWLLARRLAVPARWAAAGTMLLASQFVFLLLQGWMHAEGFRPLSPLWVRGWAVAIPVLLILAVCRSSEARTSTNPAGAAA